MNDSLTLRTATNRDGDGIIELIGSVYAEYDDQVCLTGAEQDLLDIESTYINAGGMFWVLVDGEKVVGSHAALPFNQSTSVCHFKRLYLDRALRGTEWGHRLMQVTIDWVAEKGFARVEFWSDTRFERAHRFFEKFDFKRDGREREMFDGVDPYREYFYYLDLPRISKRLR